MHSPAATDQWLSFKVGSESYAQPIAAIKEVIRYTPPIPVPGAPEIIDGILNVRGEVITILCGQALLVPDQPATTDDSRIMIVETGQGQVGISVDAVNEIITLEDQMIEPTAHSMRQDLIVGTAQHDNQLLILVDFEPYCEKTTAQYSAAHND